MEAVREAQRKAKRGPVPPEELNRAKKEYFDFRESRKKRFMQKKALMYQAVYARIRTEVANVAREKDNRIVKRLKPLHVNKSRPLDPKVILQKLNQEVVYQADERIDPTKEVFKRLVATDPGLSTRPTDASPFATTNGTRSSSPIGNSRHRR